MAVFWSISPVKLLSKTIAFMGYLGNNSVLFSFSQGLLTRDCAERLGLERL